MFNWFRNFRGHSTGDYASDMKKIGDDMNKIIPFPETAKTPQVPELDQPKEKPATTYYRLGITDTNRVSFNMGYSEITLNKMGVDNMIKQLEVFRDQLDDEE
jgi:hypothetical protein